MDVGSLSLASHLGVCSVFTCTCALTVQFVPNYEGHNAMGGGLDAGLLTGCGKPDHAKHWQWGHSDVSQGLRANKCQRLISDSRYSMLDAGGSHR